MSRTCARVATTLWMATGLALASAGPASAQVAVVGDLLVERPAETGETYRGALTLRNTSDTVQVATLRLADYRFDATGANWFDAAGSNTRSNSGWITLSQQSVSLPPQGTQVVNYTVAVPQGGPSLVGTYWSVVLVEVDNRSTVAPDPLKFSLTPKTRYGVQIATHVIGEARECQLGFGQPRIKAGEMSIDVSDSEVRACRPNFRLEVYSADGAMVHSTTRKGAYLYPSTSTRQAFALPTLPTGSYSFLLVADVGASRLQGAKFQVQVQ